MGALLGILGVLLLLTCLVFTGVGCSSRVPPPAPQAVISTKGVTALDRPAVRKLLERLANAPVTVKDLPHIAMWDSVEPGPIPRTDYVCPKCGEQTLYGNKNAPSFDVEGELDEWYKASKIVEAVKDLPECRREYQELRKVAGDAIVLDESQFCRKCCPSAGKPSLRLRITFQDGKTYDVKKVVADDIRALRRFLTGALVYKDAEGHEIPLTLREDRLEELLGEKLRWEWPK